jgi:hypothetical protein
MDATPYIKVSSHAEMRIRKRFGISRSAVRSHAEKAFKYGIHWKSARGILQAYLQEKYNSYNGSANNIKVYNYYIYVFNRTTLITILLLPKQFYKIIDKIKEEHHGKYSNKSYKTE